MQLFHQFAAILQTAGGIDQQHIDAAILRRTHGIEYKASGIGPGLTSDHFGTGALAPNLQLIDRGGAKRVSGRQHHAAAFGAELRRKLADCGGLAGAVDTGNQNNERLLRRIDHERLRHREQDLLDLGGNHSGHFGRRNCLVMAAFGQRIADPVRSIKAEIGAHEDILDLGDRCGIELALGNKVGNGAAQRRGGALEPAGKATPQTVFRFGRAFAHFPDAVASVVPVIAVS